MSLPATPREPSLLEVLAKPGSKAPGIRVLDGGVVQVRVRPRAVEGRANEAVLEALAEALGLPPSALALAAGESSRRKRVRIAGLTPREALARIASRPDALPTPCSDAKAREEEP